MTLLRAGRPVLLAVVLSSCNWISLAEHALTYETVRRGEAANVAVLDSIAYATQAENGFVVLDTRSGQTIATIPPPAGSESVDDLTAAGDLLFVLDARAPGYLSVFSLRDARRPSLVSPPRAVPVEPFAGVSANDGLCIVSGGTSALTAWRYDSLGALQGPFAQTDLGRGQPDVLVARGGTRAFVSTHYWGPYFGIDVVGFAANDTLAKLSELRVDGAGFTDGGAKPANFPIEGAQLDDATLLLAYARGVAVIDVANPEAPKLRRVIGVGGPAVNVDALHGVAAVAVVGDAPAVVLLDFTARESRIVRRITLPAGTIPIAVALSDRTVVVAARDHGVVVVQR